MILVFGQLSESLGAIGGRLLKKNFLDGVPPTWRTGELFATSTTFQVWQTGTRLSYAVIKNLRQRSESFAAILDGSDQGGDIGASKSPLTSGPEDSAQGSSPAIPRASTASPGSSLDFETALYSASNPEDDFGLFLLDPLASQTHPALTASVDDPTDANGSTSIVASDFPCTTPAGPFAVHAQDCNNASTPSGEEYMPDDRENGGASSLALQAIPEAMQSEFPSDVRNDRPYEKLWEPQNDSLEDTWTSAAMEGLTTDVEYLPMIPSAIDAAIAMVESKRVSLVLEDMQPDMANRVTSLLLNSNVNVKMKMTVQWRIVMVQVHWSILIEYVYVK